MSNSKSLNPITFGLALSLSFLLLTAPARANCVDNIGRLDFAAPVMQKHWAELQTRQNFPWGAINPYDRIQGDQLWLKPSFETLTSAQKHQALALLHLGNDWYELVQKWVPAQELTEDRMVEVGALPPYAVYASDGRLISAVYDGCTREVMFTERQRFQWYTNRRPAGARPVDLYNGGHPAWRRIHFALAPAKEKAVRLAFWRAVGFAKADAGWWISWVPEQGHFEIDLPSARELPSLQRAFLNQAPGTYTFVVRDQDGNSLAVYSQATHPQTYKQVNAPVARLPG